MATWFSVKYGIYSHLKYTCFLYSFQLATDNWQTVSFRADPKAAIKERPVCFCLEINPGPSTHNQSLYRLNSAGSFDVFLPNKCLAVSIEGTGFELSCSHLLYSWFKDALYRIQVAMFNNSKHKLLMLCVMRCAVRNLRRVFPFSLPSSHLLFPSIKIFVTAKFHTCSYVPEY